MPAGAPVTVATAQILVTVGGNAGVALAEIGAVGAKSLEGAQLQADALSNSIQRVSTAVSNLGANELGLATETRALAVSQEASAVAMVEQSAAAELFGKKLTKVLNGTAILTKMFKTFTTFLVGGIIYGGIGALVSWAEHFIGIGHGASEAGKAIDAVTEAVKRLQQTNATIGAGTVGGLKSIRFADGSVEYARTYAREIGQLSSKFDQMADAYQRIREEKAGKYGPGARELDIDNATFASFAAKFPTEAQKIGPNRREGETDLDTMLRLIIEDVERLNALDPAASLQRAADAQRAIDKNQQAAAHSALEFMNSQRDSADLAEVASKDQQQYALRLKATALMMDMQVDSASRAAYTANILESNKRQVFALADEELAQREKLLGLSQQEIEILQLKETLQGSLYKISDGGAEIRARTDQLRALQAAERSNELSRNVADIIAEVPAEALFRGNLKQAAIGAFKQAVEVSFASAFTRPLADAIYEAFRTTQLPAVGAETALAAALPPHALAVASLAAVMPAHTAALYVSAGVHAGSTLTTGGVAAHGAVWSGSFKPYAYGGVAHGPTLGLVGEGPYPAEAMVPLPDGRSIPVSFENGGGNGEIHVHIHMNPQVIDSRDFRAHLSQNADHLGDVIEAQLRGKNRRLVNRTRKAASGRA